MVSASLNTLAIVCGVLLLLPGDSMQQAIATDAVVSGSLEQGSENLVSGKPLDKSPQAIDDLKVAAILDATDEKTAANTTATPEDMQTARAKALPTQAELTRLPTPALPVIKRLVPRNLGHLIRTCDCKEPYSAPLTDDHISHVRSVSNLYMSGGNAVSPTGLSNYAWAFGQFIDHDMVATLDDPDSKRYQILLDHPGLTATMTLERLIAKEDPVTKCRMPITTTTPIIDAGPVYSNDKSFEQNTLRKPGSCKLRVNAAKPTPESRDTLPLTTENENGKVFFVAGDLRVNEHAVLTAMHTIWVREHNRICEVLDLQRCWNVWWKRRSCQTRSPRQKFELAKLIVTAKLQRIVAKEFLPALGISKWSLWTTRPKVHDNTVSVEFATAAYRMGHDMVPEEIGTFPTKALFGGEKFFLDPFDKEGRMPRPDSVMDDLLANAARGKSNAVDCRVSDALRNVLFGGRDGTEFGEDLVSRNLFRNLDMNMLEYPELAKCFNKKPGQTTLPDTVKDVFPYLLLDNNNPKKKVLGNTLRAVIRDQFYRVLFGKGGYWIRAKQLGKFRYEVARTTLAKVVNENSGANIQGSAFYV